MSAFDIFKCRESLISSQLFCAIKASDINVLTSPHDLAWASLVLLLLVNSTALSMSVNQSSSCEESCPFKMGISCNKVFSRDVFFCAVHKVSVYQSSTFSMGLRCCHSTRDKSFNLCSISCMASLGLQVHFLLNIFWFGQHLSHPILILKFIFTPVI